MEKWENGRLEGLSFIQPSVFQSSTFFFSEGNECEKKRLCYSVGGLDSTTTLAIRAR